MPGGGVVLLAPTDVDRIEAPVTFKAYLMYVPNRIVFAPIVYGQRLTGKQVCLCCLWRHFLWLRFWLC